MHVRSYSIDEIIDSELVPAPAEISNEMSKLHDSNEYQGDSVPIETSDLPEGDINEGVSSTRTMRKPRRAYNNMW